MPAGMAAPRALSVVAPATQRAVMWCWLQRHPRRWVPAARLAYWRSAVQADFIIVSTAPPWESGESCGNSARARAPRPGNPCDDLMTDEALPLAPVPGVECGCLVATVGDYTVAMSPDRPLGAGPGACDPETGTKGTPHTSDPLEGNHELPSCGFKLRRDNQSNLRRPLDAHHCHGNGSTTHPHTGTTLKLVATCQALSWERHDPFRRGSVRHGDTSGCGLADPPLLPRPCDARRPSQSTEPSSVPTLWPYPVAPPEAAATPVDASCIFTYATAKPAPSRHPITAAHPCAMVVSASVVTA